ncbi:MAG: sigma-70 family RNA polymerase sigma factor [Deltaproteobacteria bacterium]
MQAMQVDELMAEMGWVRRLARGLLRDGDAADDIAQDAWLVASARAPEDGRPLRPWLHRVVVNLVRMRRRGDSRREARELASGDDRAVPSSEQLLERIETQRVLAVEVIALAEPYRSTILLHYVEGLSSADIARRLGIPSATVRQRLKHGLDELRDRLRARADGPKRGWIAALVPLARVRPEPALAVGALAMKKLIAIGIVLVLLLLAGGVAWRVVRQRRGEAEGLGASGRRDNTGPRIALVTTIDKREVALPPWLAQTGAPSRRVAGRVVFEGAVVVGATVRIGVIPSNARIPVPAMTPGPPFVEIAERVTNAGGEFDFGALPPASFVISAEAEGKAPVSIGITIADPKLATDHLVLVLGSCRTRVTGVVRDTVSPIARARLKVAGLAGGQSDDKGRFAVCVPFTQFPNIRVEADGYGSINVQVPAMYGEMHRDFVLVPEATIEGRVIDEAGGVVAGAVVFAAPALADAQDEASTVEAIADAQGEFRLVGLAPTKYALGASAEHGQSVDRVMIVAAAGTATHGIKLVIGKRARLRGKVMMAGAPVEGAHVGVAHDGRANGSTTVAISQADGSFTLDGAPLGAAIFVAAPYEVVTPTALIVHGDVDGLVIEVAAKATLRGRVTRHGTPAASTRVELIPSNAAVNTDSDGAYLLEGLPAGAFDLYASNPQAFTRQPVTLVAGQTQQIDLELDSGGEIRGTVVDRSGAPVVGVFVEFVAPGGDDTCSSLTDEHGAFDCATLTGGCDYHVGVFPNTSKGNPYPSAAGGAFPAVHVKDGNSVVRGVRLAIDHEELAISGKVVDDTGLTMPDARVTVGDANQWGDPARTRAGDDGGFIIEGLAHGHYDLRARLADGSVGDAKQVAAGTTGVTIALVRPGTIEGSLVGFVRPPMVLATIGTYTEQDIHEARVTGDQFSITGLKPGSYTVQALGDGIQLAGTTTDVRGNATTHVELIARPRTTLDGRVLQLGTTTPIARMSCHTSLSLDQREGTSVGPVPAQQLTDATGAFSLDTPTGRTRVTCDSSDPSFSAAGGNFDVVVTGSSRVEVYAVKVVTPASNPRFALDPALIPPTVLRATRSSPIVAGDVILTVDGVDVTNMLAGTVQTMLSNHTSGSSIVLQVVRGGQPLSVQVTLN